jgi:hypothetical protein
MLPLLLLLLLLLLSFVHLRMGSTVGSAVLSCLAIDVHIAMCRVLHQSDDCAAAFARS